MSFICYKLSWWNVPLIFKIYFTHTLLWNWTHMLLCACMCIGVSVPRKAVSLQREATTISTCVCSFLTWYLLSRRNRAGICSCTPLAPKDSIIHGMIFNSSLKLHKTPRITTYLTDIYVVLTLDLALPWTLGILLWTK